MDIQNYDRHILDKLSRDYYMQTNHIRVVEVKPGYAKLVMDVTEVSLNGFGFIHGGAMFGLADTAAGTATFTDGRHYVTQNGNFQFLGNVNRGMVTAEGTVIHRGRTITVTEVKVYAEDGKLLGSGTYTMFAVNKDFRTK